MFLGVKINRKTSIRTQKSSIVACPTTFSMFLPRRNLSRRYMRYKVLALTQEELGTSIHAYFLFCFFTFLPSWGQQEYQKSVNRLKNNKAPSSAAPQRGWRFASPHAALFWFYRFSKYGQCSCMFCWPWPCKKRRNKQHD